MTRYLSLLALLLLTACDDSARQRAPDAAAAAIEADVRFLADDLLEGRETGTRGYDLAARYVAAQFRQIGLEPAGAEHSYLQSVPLLKATRVKAGSGMQFLGPGKRLRLKFQDEFLPGVSFDQTAVELTAPMVFVGQAVQAPELDHDDFAGVDVRGKIAVYFSNAPARFPNDERAYYASRQTKAATLVRLGAVGAIALGNPEDEAKRPWAMFADNWQQAQMRWLDGDGAPVDAFPELKVSAVLSAAASERLFKENGQDWLAALAALKSGRSKAFDFIQRVSIAQRSAHERLSSQNVIARWPGAGRKADQHIVFTAHLDHVGIGAPVDGDAIYNGALDNALGVAILLEAARRFASGPPLARSVLFIALTGEEKGLLGADYFARNPTVPAGRLIANINMDMPILLTPTSDAIPIGIEHSSLAEQVRQAATDLGMTLSPDPTPEENVFVRSDQYAFIRQGIPAVYLDGGIVASNGDGVAVLRDFLRQHYHRPSDEVDLPIQYADAERLARLNHRIAELIAADEATPRWHQGDFFGKRFGAR